MNLLKKNKSLSKVNESKVLISLNNLDRIKILEKENRPIRNLNNSYNLPFLIDDITKEELNIVRWEWEIYWIWNQDNTIFIWDLCESDFNIAVNNKIIKILTPNDKEVMWNTADYILVKNWELNERMNVKELLDNLTVNTFINTEQYKIINNVFEKFSHNICENAQYDIDSKEWQLMQFEVWENWNDKWMSRTIDILIKYNDWKTKGENSFYIKFIDNKNELWKAIRYHKYKWWRDHPFTNAGQYLEKNNDDWKIVTLKNYTWDEKTDISTLQDWQKINIINQCDFDVVEIKWIYKLIDFQKGNINNIEDDRFNNIDEIVDRLETYIYDYFFKD